jgi:hypothetical protein
LRVPRAYRSLARPSSASEPSHSPGGIAATCDSVKRVQWTPGSHVHAASSTRPVVGCVYRPFPSALARDGASVLRIQFRSLSHIRDTTSSGYGLWTHWDLNPGPPPCKGGALPLSYGPVRRTVSALVVHRCPVGFVCPMPPLWARLNVGSRSVGGDPAADSPTATLLRLKPPCETQIRPLYSGLIRTSLGCFDGRCVQGAGTYSPRATDTRLLPNPAS